MTWGLVAQIVVLMFAFGMVYDLFIKPYKWDRPRNHSGRRGPL